MTARARALPLSVLMILAAGAGLAAGGCVARPEGKPAPGAPGAEQSSANPTGPGPRRVANAGRPEGSVVGVEAWTFETFPGRAIRTANYSLYTTASEPIITDRLPGFLEAALQQYIALITPLPRPRARMDTFVMATRQQWQRLTLRMLGPSGVPVTYIERGGFTSGGRSYLFDIGQADTFSIASHEGWHQFSQTTFKERLPITLEEGLATYFEGHRWIGADVVFLPWANLERFDRLRDAASRRGQDGFMPLEELLAASPQSLMTRGSQAPLTYYAQAWALIHFLREGDGGRWRPGFERLVSDAAGGVLGRTVQLSLGTSRPGMLAQSAPGAVFRAYFGADPAQLDPAFQEFLRQIVQTGGRSAIVEGRSPVTR